MGLCELSSQLAGEESHYRDLAYGFWIIFDGLLRAIIGVEINADLTGVKPHRTQHCCSVQETTCDFYPNKPNNPRKSG